MINADRETPAREPCRSGSGRVIENRLRALAPEVLGALTRRYGSFDLCEDATQEALLAAATQWPVDGVPDNPRGWLVTVAGRRLVDQLRSESARHRRELAADAVLVAPAVDAEAPLERDDSLTLLFLCCHPALTAPSQIALTLRSVGGLTTAEIARAFLVPEPTMAQRISRAKQRLSEVGARFSMPPPEEVPARLAAVLQVLYLIFNEGYSATSGPDLVRVELSDESIRLTRVLHTLRPDDGEVIGLLALQLLTEARRPARVAGDGSLVPLAAQDRALWSPALIAEGVGLISGALQSARLGPYQLQAAIAAVHTEAADDAATDWPQIMALYELLEAMTTNPVVTLNRAVAMAMVDGPAAGLALLDSVAGDARLARHHRLPAVQAHLLEMSGDLESARTAYLAAARRATSDPEQRHLRRRAALLPDS